MSKVTFSYDRAEPKPTGYISKKEKCKFLSGPYILFPRTSGGFTALFSDGAGGYSDASNHDLEEDFEPIYGPITVTINP